MTKTFSDLSLDEDALRAALQRMQLCNAEQSVTAEMLTGGVSSNVLKVTVGDKTLCLKQALPKLKVAKDWTAPIDRVFSEIDWMQTVASIVPDAVPKILGIDKATGSFAMEFLTPESYANWKTQLLRGEVDLSIATQLGSVLGQIHARTARNPQLAQIFATDTNFYALRLEPYLVETTRNHPALHTPLQTVIDTTAHTKLALVHGDISPKNILIGPRGPVILDAECAWYGDPAFDLAFCLNHLLLKALHVAGKSTECLAAYSAMSAAYLNAVDWEPVADFDRRCSALLPCLMLARVDGKSPAEYLNDAERLTVRQTTSVLIEHAPLQLVTIKELWERKICS